MLYRVAHPKKRKVSHLHIYENGIELNHLNILNDEHLKELCPLMGVRIDLKKKINDHIEAQATTESVTTNESVLIDVEDEIICKGDLSINLSELFPLLPQFQDFDLKTLLETSPCGKSILQFYNTNGCLDTKRRNRLTDIIIRHLFTFIVNKRLTYDDYTILSGKIITLFPQETASTYFTRPIKKVDSHRGKSIAAKGKLIDRVRNLLFQSGERKRKSENNSETLEIETKKRIDSDCGMYHN
ncbi:hypothetical protein PYW07_006646 [Mythimna separata]|uniref:Uncharacterized protein n=1 Tax=Mythimna separata TaxID=271217 RepID=A0AAD7YV57_MYTSE|nr:hypothetical protein PYW07_006646 [Mythimna separata]